LRHADQARLRRFFLSERQPLHRARKCSVGFFSLGVIQWEF
jgi:hypothetical protein